MSKYNVTEMMVKRMKAFDDLDRLMRIEELLKKLDEIDKLIVKYKEQIGELQGE